MKKLFLLFSALAFSLVANAANFPDVYVTGTSKFDGKITNIFLTPSRVLVTGTDKSLASVGTTGLITGAGTAAGASDVTTALGYTPALSAGGVYQPYDLSKLYMVWMSDSLGWTNAAHSTYPYVVMSLPQWQGTHYWTNIGNAGDNYYGQTNSFYTGVLPNLPPAATNGTNVIIVYNTYNDLIGIAKSIRYGLYTNFFADVKARIPGSKIVFPTPSQRFGFASQESQLQILQHGFWLTQCSNLVDVIPDQLSVFSDPADLNLFSDGTHFTDAGSTNAAYIFDAAIRQQSRTPIPQHIVRNATSLTPGSSANAWSLLRSDGNAATSWDDAGGISPKTVMFNGVNYSQFILFQDSSGSSKSYGVWDGKGQHGLRELGANQDVMFINNRPVTLTNNVATAFAYLEVSGRVSGQIFLNIEASTVTENQVAQTRIAYAGYSYVGTKYYGITEDTNSIAKVVSSGTLTWTISMDAPTQQMFITVASSLTTPTIKCTYHILQSGTGASRLPWW